ncbi:metallophosphoesterase [Wenyingzhuangia sp. 1_MG-2023]|nr:metallophosphoesterase [Wenyingzhuangia sp. 1_MG-2023]
MGCVAIMFIGGISCSGHPQLVDETNLIDSLQTPDEIFQIAILPDTQYYTAKKHGGTVEMFESQVDWVIANAKLNNIKYVTHLGDVVDHGHQQMQEWKIAKEIMYKLEVPFEGYPQGVPYGITVGNHDQDPLGDPSLNSTEDGYNLYFGKDHFKDKLYYGGAYGVDNNDNHYDIFSVYGQKFIVLYIEYNEPGNEFYDESIENSVFQWGKDVLKQYSDHKAIIVSHNVLARPDGSNSITTAGQGNNNIPSTYTNQGEKIYNWFKTSSNVFMMLCGHRSGEGYRVDTYKGNTIKSFLSDYQSREDENENRNGGGGLMRTIDFNMTRNTMSIKTFAPKNSSSINMELDEDSFFTVKLFE